ncbi:MAG: DUF6515 family protein, partial [Planctomycetota bacterium]
MRIVDRRALTLVALALGAMVWLASPAAAGPDPEPEGRRGGGMSRGRSVSRGGMTRSSGRSSSRGSVRYSSRSRSSAARRSATRARSTSTRRSATRRTSTTRRATPTRRPSTTTRRTTTGRKPATTKRASTTTKRTGTYRTTSTRPNVNRRAAKPASHGQRTTRANHHRRRTPTQRVGHVSRALPVGHSRHVVNGKTWYYRGGVFYRGQGSAFVIGHAPYGCRVRRLPHGHIHCWVRQRHYYYWGGTYYYAIEEDDEVEYEVVEAPEGALVPELPEGAKPVSIGGRTYYRHNEVLYRPVF